MKSSIPLLVVLLVWGASSDAQAYIRPGDTRQLDVSPVGSQPTRPPNQAVFAVSSTSADGRFVAFDSIAHDLVAGDTNLLQDIFVRDRQNDVTQRVSVTSGGLQATGLPPPLARGSSLPQISAAGRYVVFQSEALTLVAGDTNGTSDVFVRDLKLGTTERVSVASTGAEGNLGSSYGSISDNGRFVVFSSLTDELVPNDDNQKSDVFLHDRKTNKTEIISLDKDDAQFDGAHAGSISADGKYVIFEAQRATDKIFPLNIYGRNLVTGKTELLSNGGAAEPEERGNSTVDAQWTRTRLISANNRWITFSSAHPGLVPNDTSANTADVFVFDRRTRKTERVSVSSAGEESVSGNIGNNHSFSSSLSGNGRLVAFRSGATNLASDYGNEDYSLACAAPVICKLPDRVFVHDMLTGATEMVSRTPDGEDARPPFPECDFGEVSEAIGPVGGVSLPVGLKPDSYSPSLSWDGNHVSFTGCGLVPEEKVDPTGASTPLRMTHHIYVRSLGRSLGAELPRDDADDAGSGLRPGSLVSAADGLGDACRISCRSDAEITGATAAHRPWSGDIYLKIDVERLTGPRGGISGLPAAGDPSVLYRVSLETESGHFEVRAARSGVLFGPGLPMFGLFECSEARCSEVARLVGGFGTVGDTIVTAVPLKLMGLGAMDDVKVTGASTAIGTYPTGAVTVLDRIDL